MRNSPAILATLALNCLLVACSPPRAPNAETQSGLKQVYYTFRTLEQSRHKSIAEVFEEVKPGASLDDKWKSLVLEIATEERFPPKLFEEQMCKDGYGRLWNIERRSVLIGRGASTNLTKCAFEIVFWSSGPNGINEFGRGDDVVLK